jgi:Peptide methionine sulfoxide reductase
LAEDQACAILPPPGVTSPEPVEELIIGGPKLTTGDMLTGEPGGKIKILDKEICMGTTGHAQVVQVNFDPAVIAFDEILDFFFAIHVSPKLSKFRKLLAAKRKAS